jgi:predicted homoserine dehydrogenase-like protein
MILVDNALRALEAKGTPLRVAIVGAGFMCQGLANHIAHSVPGMRIVAISNRKLNRALDFFPPASRTLPSPKAGVS